MSQATIRTAIYNVVNGVSDVGKVYDYERFIDTWTEFLGLFKTTIGTSTQVRGWMVGYAGHTNEELFDCVDIRRHRFIVRGFLRFDDSASSEKTGATLAETIINAMNTDATIHAHSETPTAQFDIYEARMFGSVLCHYSEITQEVVEEI